MAHLSVGVPRAVAAYPVQTGTGKVWHQILAHLPEAGIEVVQARPNRWRRHPRLWLSDGHRGALPVRARVVMQLHEAPWRDPDGARFLYPPFAEHMSRVGDAAAEQATLIITASEYSRDEIINAHRVDPARVRVVPHGVDGRMFNPERRQDGLAMMQRLGVDRPYIAFVSVAHPRKNLPALRTALTELADRGIEHVLVAVLSTAKDRPDPARFVEEARAQLPGHPDRVFALENLSEPEVASVMAAADVLCAPSFSEGFGLTPLEAMACGTPVVVSDRGSLPEVVGDAGVIVRPDAQELAEALFRVIDDRRERQRLAEAGAARAANFTWDASARGWAAVLREASD